MTCLNLEEVYRYLEEEVTTGEKEKIEEHLTSCPECQIIVEDRRFFLQALSQLPPLEVPPEFASKVMSRIFPKKITLPSWLISFGAGLSALFLSLLALIVIYGLRPEKILFQLNENIILRAKNILVLVTKSLKMLFFVFNLIVKVGETLFQGIILCSAMTSPYLQILVSLIVFSLVILVLYGAGKRLSSGEKT